MNKKFTTSQITLLGLMIAILLLMAYTPLGYLNIGPLAITFNIIPVAISAITMGPVGGAIAGAVFGLTSFGQCIGIGGTSLMGVMSGFLGRMGLRPFYNKAEKKEARELMEKTRITDLADRCYRQLSGGQQQRVLLTRALCATRKILLLDEPVSGLDPVATADMYQIINELNKEDRVTIIMISHDIGEVATYASHVLHIGQKVFFGTKEEYLESKIGKRLVDAGEEGKA